jgi:predicted xylose isomerase-like sugar epimerase
MNLHVYFFKPCQEIKQELFSKYESKLVRVIVHSLDMIVQLRRVQNYGYHDIYEFEKLTLPIKKYYDT